jgi:hypothetical protein
MIDRDHLAKLMKIEEKRYLARTKKSAKLFARSKEIYAWWCANVLDDEVAGCLSALC